MEAPGNAWVARTVTLHEASYRVAVVNPRQAHHCATAPLRRAQTDAFDARDRARRQWPVVVAGVRQHRDALSAARDRRIAALGAESATVRQERVWAASLACLTSAPGLGLVTAAGLLARTLSCARCTGPAARSASAGRAPVPRESGRSIRGRATIGHDGNGRLRTALSMATCSAARCNPASTACYQRLRARLPAPALRPGSATPPPRCLARAHGLTDQYR